MNEVPQAATGTGSGCDFSGVTIGWVTPGAATEGGIPLFFFPEKPGDLF